MPAMQATLALLEVIDATGHYYPMRIIITAERQSHSPCFSLYR